MADSTTQKFLPEGLEEFVDRMTGDSHLARVLFTTLPVTLIELIFFLGPLVIMIWISFLQVKNFQLVYDYTFQNYIDIFTRAANRSAFQNTVVVSVLATIATVVVAYPLAYFIARFGGRYQNYLLLLVIIPFWTNYVVRVYGWRILLSREGLINIFLRWLGVIDQPIPWLLNTKFAVWVGQIYLLLPFMILPLYSSLEQIGRSTIEAGYDLGATKFDVFRRIVFPLSIPGLVAGTMFVVIFNMGMFISPSLLGGGALFIGPRINYEFGYGANWPSGAALGASLMTVVLITLWILLRYANLEEMFGERGVGGGDEQTTNQPGSSRTKWAIYGSTLLIYAFLYIPLIVIVLFSFEKGSFSKLPWSGFTLEWYVDLLNNNSVISSIKNSLYVAVVATVVATVVGILGAIAHVRFDFRLKKAFKTLVITPMTIPGLILGIALLLWFKYLGVTTSLVTVMVGQLVFIIPFVLITVSSRLRGIDLALEEAARDLGAGRWMVYRKVTLPLLMPGIISGALFAFALSFNDFLIAFFTSGVENTLPIWIFSKLSRGITPVIHAISTLTIIASVLLIAVSELIRRW